MTGPNARVSRGFARTITEPQVVRRIQRLAVVLGLAAILVAGLVGWSAYVYSRDGLIERYKKDTLNQARSSAELLAVTATPRLEPTALARVGKKFEAEKSWENAHLCVVNGEGRLVLHTRSPENQGRFVGDRVLFEAETEGSKPLTLLELIGQLKPRDDALEVDPAVHGRVGMCTSLEGEQQLVAFAYAQGADAVVVIHVPWESVDRQIDKMTRPWAIGLGLIVLFALPLAMWGLLKAVFGAQRAAEEARAAERRSAENVRILREVDRAILAGGSVQETVSAALGRLSNLVPFQRASVALFDFERGVNRILAVQGPNATEIGAGTEIPLRTPPTPEFEKLRSGETVLIPNLDAAGELFGFYKKLRTEGLRSVARVPLRGRGDLLGTLNLGFERVGGPAPEDLDLAREIADVLALAVLQARMREELQAQAAELERRVQERTRELSEVNAELQGYVHSVSHDLRAPLRAVHGFGTLLLEDAGSKLSPTEREYLERMLSASDRMNELMSDLLDYSRLAREDIDIRPLDTEHVVEASQDLLQVELDEQGAVVDIVRPLLPVAGHHSSFVQAMTNLLSNAAKFVAPGVRPRIKVWTEPRGDRVRLWVEDNGIGIAPEKQEKIFRVFERLNGVDAYPGTGIGLAIVRRAAERMGATTGVESVRGEGSRFWIEFDRAERKP